MHHLFCKILNLFSVKETGPVQLISCLVPETSVLSHLDIGDDFLTDFVKRFKDNGLKEIFIPIFTALSKRMQTVTILDSYLPLLNTMIKLTKFPDIAKVVRIIVSVNANTTISWYHIQTGFPR